MSDWPSSTLPCSDSSDSESPYSDSSSLEITTASFWEHPIAEDSKFRLVGSEPVTTGAENIWLYRRQYAKRSWIVKDAKGLAKDDS